MPSIVEVHNGKWKNGQMRSWTRIILPGGHRELPFLGESGQVIHILAVACDPRNNETHAYSMKPKTAVDSSLRDRQGRLFHLIRLNDLQGVYPTVKEGCPIQLNNDDGERLVTIFHKK